MRTRTKLAFLIVGTVLIPLLVTTTTVAMRVARIEREEPATGVAAYRWVQENARELLHGEEPQETVQARPAGSEIASFTADGTVRASSLREFSVGAEVDYARVFRIVADSGQEWGAWLQSFPSLPSHTDPPEVPPSPEAGSPPGQPEAGVDADTPPAQEGATGAVLVVHHLSSAGQLERMQVTEAFLFGGAALVAFAALMGYGILRGIRRNLLTFEEATERIAAGDLDFEIHPTGKDEFAALSRSFDEMRRALKEEYARRARFIMGVSHDLRTPISLIEGYAEALQDGLVRDETRRAHYLHVIREKAGRLESMVSELLDLTRLETGEWRKTLKPIRIAPFLTELGRRLEMDCSLYSRSFSYHISVPAQHHVLMDDQMVTRVFENIFANALQHTDEEDRIELTADVVLPDFQETQDSFCGAGFSRPSKSAAGTRDGSRPSVRVGFCNTGPGMSEEERKHAFEPFFRGSPARRDGGFGLGLANAKAVVDAHGWEISIVQTDNRLCFVLLMPIEKDGDDTPNRQT